MSIKAINYVWEHSEQRGVKLLVLLAIADYADEHGRAHPSAQALAAKARISERSVQYAVRSLADDGEIVIQDAAGPNGTNVYVLPAGGASRAPAQTPRGAKAAGVQKLQGANRAPQLQSKPGGANRAPVQTVAPKPITSSSSSKHTQSSNGSYDDDVGGAVGGAGATSSSQHESFAAVCDACGFDTALLEATDRVNAGKLASECREIGVTPEQIRIAGELWFTVKWKFKPRDEVTPPSIKQLRAWIGQCRKRSQAPAVVPAPAAPNNDDWGWPT